MAQDQNIADPLDFSIRFSVVLDLIGITDNRRRASGVFLLAYPDPLTFRQAQQQSGLSTTTLWRLMNTFQGAGLLRSEKRGLSTVYVSTEYGVALGYRLSEEAIRICFLHQAGFSEEVLAELRAHGYAVKPEAATIQFDTPLFSF